MIGIAASAIVLAMLMYRAGLWIDPLDRGTMPYYLCGLVAITVRLCSRNVAWRHARAVGDCAEHYAVFTFVALMGAVASYPVAALTHGFHDAALQRIDTALHFDWLAWYRAVAAHPILQTLGLGAYRSIYITPALLLAYFAGTDQRGAAHRFLGVFWLTAVMTLLLYALMPAVGPFSYLWHGPITYMPESELWQPGLIPALRDHRVQMIDLGHLRGLVSAPSFHAAAAVIYIHTAWPIRRLRWPVLAINIAMLLSTPVEGTHYLADMIIGALVVVVAILLSRRVLPEGAA